MAPPFPLAAGDAPIAFPWAKVKNCKLSLAPEATRIN
jgi:hypothetical protein